MDPDPLGSVVSYAWDFNGDGTTDLTTTSPDPVTHAYGAFANYTARLTVTDDMGATGTSTVVVQVVNATPVAALSISPATAITGQTVTFSAAGSLDPDGTIVKYEWDLDGNGTYETATGTTSSVSRSFPNRMRVNARVRVTDNDGATAIASGALAVDPALVTPPPPGPSGGGTGGSAPGSGPGSGPGAGAAAATPTGAFTATLAGTSIQKLKTVLRKGVKIRCSVDRKATCTVLLVMKARDVKRLRLARGKRARRSMTVARATMKTTAAGARTLKLKFKSSARRRLRRARRLVLMVKGTAKDATGATARLQRVVLLR
jgi:YD repeat-containing protein